MNQDLDRIIAAGAADGSLPAYATQIDAFHCAFESELRVIVARIPCEPGQRVLDVGCGDGFYTALLAERLGVDGEIVGLDESADYLKIAKRRIAALQPRCRVDYVRADIDSSATQAAKFDLVWCAQSLYSFPEPVVALQRIASALKPGGIMVVMENDTFHELLLPWPPELELAVRTAEYAALADQSNHPRKYYVGRRLPAVFAAAGLEPLGFETRSVDRSAPLDVPTERFLRCYLERLAERIRPFVDPVALVEFSEALLLGGHKFLLCSPHFTFTWTNVVAWGRRSR